jgi:succinate dehydrogenase / fumarate reductase membrane anchor subunit
MGMVTSITSFGRSGLYDWLIQRVTAVVLSLYALFLVGFLLFNPGLNFQVWAALYSGTTMRIFSLMALMSLGAHCWIGLWSVSTDYIKPFGYRFLFQGIAGAAMFAYTIWGIQLLWGL